MSRQYRNRSIAGRTVAVTGGARGIGRAIAAELSARGAAVVIGDIDSETASDTAAALGLAGACRLDVTDPASFETFLDRAQDTVGPLDTLINNAGVMPLGLFTSEPGTRAPFGLLAEPEDVARAIADLVARPRRRVTVTPGRGLVRCGE